MPPVITSPIIMRYSLWLLSLSLSLSLYIFSLFTIQLHIFLFYNEAIYESACTLAQVRLDLVAAFKQPASCSLYTARLYDLLLRNVAWKKCSRFLYSHLLIDSLCINIHPNAHYTLYNICICIYSMHFVSDDKLFLLYLNCQSFERW